MSSNRVEAILDALRGVGIPATNDDVDEFLDHLDDNGFSVVES